MCCDQEGEGDDERSLSEKEYDNESVLEDFSSAFPEDLYDYEIYCSDEIQVEIRLSNCQQ